MTSGATTNDAKRASEINNILPIGVIDHHVSMMPPEVHLGGVCFADKKLESMAMPYGGEVDVASRRLAIQQGMAKATADQLNDVDKEFRFGMAMALKPIREQILTLNAKYAPLIKEQSAPFKEEHQALKTKTQETLDRLLSPLQDEASALEEQKRGGIISNDVFVVKLAQLQAQADVLTRPVHAQYEQQMQAMHVRLQEALAGLEEVIQKEKQPLIDAANQISEQRHAAMEAKLAVVQERFDQGQADIKKTEMEMAREAALLNLPAAIFLERECLTQFADVHSANTLPGSAVFSGFGKKPVADVGPDGKEVVKEQFSYTGEVSCKSGERTTITLSTDQSLLEDITPGLAALTNACAAKSAPEQAR